MVSAHDPWNDLLRRQRRVNYARRRLAVLLVVCLLVLAGTAIATGDWEVHREVPIEAVP